ncbi:kinase-like protein [Ramaria rubella]|nr:kinase-like protein [Ramaria rubella]
MSTVPPELLGKTSNQRVSVGADGKPCVDLTFVEEPLGIPAQEGYGWPQLEFNQTVGPENRYVILRKLGWGMSSSTWLARDQMGKSYVALKVLNGYTTDLVSRGRVWKLEALKRISSPPSDSHYLRLLSSFSFLGKGSAGRHLCYVTPVLGGDVKSLHNEHNQVFPFPLAKRILLHLLRGIAHAHSRGVVHTDLKHDNIFFDTHMSTDDFDTLLTSSPSCRHPPEASHDGMVQAAVSQPLPIPSLEQALLRNFAVADFGSAQLISTTTEDEITAAPLRPQEFIIGGPWDEKVDIWTFGCLVFELVTGRALFKYEPYPKYNLDEPTYLLYQMMCYTGEDFSAEQLTVSALASKYFDTTCNLKSRPPLFDYPFESSIRVYKVIDEAEVVSIANLMRRCLRLNPAQRASAAELLSDPWFSPSVDDQDSSTTADANTRIAQEDS